MNTRKILPISVIIPCYKCKDTIERAIISIYYQSHLPQEIILIEDYSNDGTYEYLENIKAKYNTLNIILYSLAKNSGPASARNFGWDNASGDYIAFLDSDDTWHIKKLEIQYQIMQGNINLLMTGHPVSTYNHSSNLTQEISSIKIKYINKIILYINFFSTPSVMLKRNINQRFPQNKTYSEDYSLWLDIILQHPHQIAFLENANLGFMYKAPYGVSGLSANLWEMEKNELNNFINLYKYKKISFFIFSTVYVFSLLKYFKRVCFTRIKN